MASGNLLGDMRDIPDCKGFPIALSCSCGRNILPYGVNISRSINSFMPTADKE